MSRNRSRRIGPALAVLAGALAVAAPASAGNAVVVSGTQTNIDESAGTYKLDGGLIGEWRTTSIRTLAASPLARASGTERFTGCLDRGHDGSCSGDPGGTLKFSFLYWAKIGAGDSLVWGSCWHPIRGGTGAFAGATGVLTFVDTPTAAGVTTAYIGNVTLAGKAAARRSARASSVSPGCGGA